MPTPSTRPPEPTGRRRSRPVSAVLVALALAVLGSVLTAPAAQAATTPWKQWQTGSISAAKPKATYTFSVTSATTVRFVLGDLRANYKLTLLDSSSAVVASSDRSGVQNEEIIRPVKAGTYRAVVTSPRKQYTAAPFALAGQPLSGVAVLSHKARVLPDGRFQLALDVYNTTSSPRDWRGWVKFYDANGGYLDARPLWVWGAAVQPRKHGYAGIGLPNWTGQAPPDGWKSYRITDVSAGRLSCIPNLTLPVTNFKVVTDPGDVGKWRWSGLVRNTDTRRGQTAKMAVATFDARGRILAATGFYRDVPAGEAVSWGSSDWRAAGANRMAMTSQQYSGGCA